MSRGLLFSGHSVYTVQLVFIVSDSIRPMFDKSTTYWNIGEVLAYRLGGAKRAELIWFCFLRTDQWANSNDLQ